MVQTADAFERVLRSELRQPRFLSPAEVAGGWRELFPDLAASLPAPYPIFAPGEEEILTWGYPVLVSPGLRRLRTEVERLLGAEIQYRLEEASSHGADKTRAMTQRDRYLRSMTALVENTLVNDYGRGLLEVLLLLHSRDLAESLAAVPRLVRQRERSASQQLGEEVRLAVASVCADLVQRAVVAASDRLRRLSHAANVTTSSAVAARLCQDTLLLVETEPPSTLARLRGYLATRYREVADSLDGACTEAVARLAETIHRQPEIGRLLELSVGSRLDLTRSGALLEPRLVEAVTTAGLTDRLGLSRRQAEVLRDLGQRLKAFELLWALRQRVLGIDREGSRMVLVDQEPHRIIASSTRPFDFTAPGVVESWVQRFGLIYDLSRFTATLEEIRKKGRRAEENALQYMYSFHRELESIRARRRLRFEKFLGDGALYSSRQALRLLAAACEIQTVYARLCREGFPFDQGLRIAANFSSYRLLPLVAPHEGPVQFEFFGHGIVELARLTTGKSTREVEEIAEFLVHSGYPVQEVDSFLRPLLAARGGREEGSPRTFAASISTDGELVNEGIVLTVPFLEEVAREMPADAMLDVVEAAGLRWAVLTVDDASFRPLKVAVRSLGVARLKGLQPLELVEASPWLDDDPRPSQRIPMERPLVGVLRRLATAQELAEDAPDPTPVIDESLVVCTYLEGDGERRWLFGDYRPLDDVVLHAIQIPMQVPDLERSGEPVETWIFRNRFELARLYDGLRRDTSGVSTPLASLRRRTGYMGCYLAAPHRAPG